MEHRSTEISPRVPGESVANFLILLCFLLLLGTVSVATVNLLNVELSREIQTTNFLEVTNPDTFWSQVVASIQEHPQTILKLNDSIPKWLEKSNGGEWQSTIIVGLDKRKPFFTRVKQTKDGESYVAGGSSVFFHQLENLETVWVILEKGEVPLDLSVNLKTTLENTLYWHIEEADQVTVSITFSIDREVASQNVEPSKKLTFELRHYSAAKKLINRASLCLKKDGKTSQIDVSPSDLLLIMHERDLYLHLMNLRHKELMAKLVALLPPTLSSLDQK